MRRVSAWVACVLISAAMQTAVFPVAGLLPVWRAQVAYVALVPWFLVLLRLAQPGRRSLIRATLLSYLCGALWYAGHCYWIFGTMHQYGQLSSAMAAVTLVLFCLYLGLYHALYGGAAVLLLQSRAGRHWFARPVLLTLLWVAVEFARAHVTSFPWDLLGYSQIDNAALVRLAPWFGTYGVGAVVLLANALIACGLSAKQTKQTRLPRTMLVSGIALALVCATLAAVVQAPEPPADQTAVLIQPNLSAGDSDDAVPGQPRPAVPLDNALAALTVSALSQASGASAHLVLWPESPASYELHEPHLQRTLTDLAASQRVTVIADANAVEPDSTVARRYRLYNAAGLFTGAGLQGRYDKVHLVPFGEFTPYASLFSFAGGLTQQVGLFDHGTRHIPLSDGHHRYGVFICYESIFPDEVRQLPLKGADVLVNLSDDGWYGDTSAPFQHSNMARMRAIENRRWLLRDTNTGITESIDPYGNVRVAAPRHQRLAAVMPFAYASDLTFYTLHGDIFAWVCAALSAVALFLSLAEAGSDGRLGR